MELPKKRRLELPASSSLPLSFLQWQNCSVTHLGLQIHLTRGVFAFSLLFSCVTSSLCGIIFSIIYDGSLKIQVKDVFGYKTS